MRGLNFGRWVSFSFSFVLACSDDGDPAQTESQSAGPESGDSGDDDDDGDDSGTNPTATDPTNATLSDDTSADGTVDDGSGSSGDTAASSDGPSEDTGPAPGGACESVADCVVVEDCCNCGVASASDPPTCDIVECEQSACDALGFDPAAQCELGSCEPVAVPCNPTGVTCEAVTPECADGFFPGITPDGTCWTGDCVPADACDIVPACDDCPEGEACVEYITHFGPQAHCSPIPEDCGGAPSCGCMPEVCVSPFDTCADGPPNLSCSCAVCG